MIHAALLDEHELVRIGLKTVLKQSRDIEVIADTGDVEQLFSLIKREQPNIVLIDIPEPDTTFAAPCASENSTDAIRNRSRWLSSQKAGAQELKSRELDLLTTLRVVSPETRVVLMSTTFSLDCLLHTLCGNAAGYLLKSSSPHELIAAVHAIACGGIYIHSTLIEGLPHQLLKSCATLHDSAPNAPALSNRERNVLDLLVKGYTNKEVSEELYLSPKTVEAYRARIYTKLGVKNRAGLFSCAVEYGLVAI